AGAALLPHVRALLERAVDLQRRAERLSGSEPVRIGYVNWLPADLAARTAGVAQLYVDPWVVPSHAHAARGGQGSFDLAVCHVRAVGRPVLNSPKDQGATLPPDLARRLVIDPAVMWTWSPVWRREEIRGL